jgi:hypothetical protein
MKLENMSGFTRDEYRYYLNSRKLDAKASNQQQQARGDHP